MTTSRKQVVYKVINVTAITTVVMLILTVYGYLYGNQKSQAQEISNLKEDVIVLKQVPVINSIVNNAEMLKQQRKQIDINTKTLAVLEVQYKSIDDKLNMIYGVVQDNNDKLYQHIDKKK